MTSQTATLHNTFDDAVWNLIKDHQGTCQLCGRSFPLEALSHFSHIASGSPGNVPNICDECGSNKDELQLLVSTH